MANEPIVLSDDMKVSGDTRWLMRDEFDVWNQTVELYASGVLQLIPDSAYTDVLWNSEHFDERGLHSTSVNTNRITIAKPGKYFVHTGIKWELSSIGTRLVFILVNGTIKIGKEESGRPFNHLMIVQRQFNLAAGDYVSVQV